MADGPRPPSSGDPVEERLHRIARATAEIGPEARFAEAVMQAVAADRVPTEIGLPLWRIGRLALAGFVAMAVACVLWSSRVESSLDERVLASFETVEWEP